MLNTSNLERVQRICHNVVSEVKVDKKDVESVGQKHFWDQCEIETEKKGCLQKHHMCKWDATSKACSVRCGKFLQLQFRDDKSLYISCTHILTLPCVHPLYIDRLPTCASAYMRADTTSGTEFYGFLKALHTLSKSDLMKEGEGNDDIKEHAFKKTERAWDGGDLNAWIKKNKNAKSHGFKGKSINSAALAARILGKVVSNL